MAKWLVHWGAESEAQGVKPSEEQTPVRTRASSVLLMGSDDTVYSLYKASVAARQA